MYALWSTCKGCRMHNRGFHEKISYVCACWITIIWETLIILIYTSFANTDCRRVEYCNKWHWMLILPSIWCLPNIALRCLHFKKCKCKRISHGRVHELRGGEHLVKKFWLLSIFIAYLRVQWCIANHTANNNLNLFKYFHVTDFPFAEQRMHEGDTIIFIVIM